MNRLARFREVLARLNPNAPSGLARLPGVFVPPPSAMATKLASRLALEPGSTHLLCGPIGSGKTTTLLSVRDSLKERLAETSDQWGMVDVSAHHEMDSESLEGVLTSLAGLWIAKRNTTPGASPEFLAAAAQMERVARGFSEWVVDPWDDEHERDDPWTQVHHKGLVKAPAHKSLARLQQPLRTLRGEHAAIVLFDSLDRLESSERFREAVEYDLPCLKEAGFGVVVVGPMRFALSNQPEERKVASFFDAVHTIPTPNPLSPDGGAFLSQVLRNRVPASEIDDAMLRELVVASGGLVRDLLNLAAGSLRAAYERGHDGVTIEDVQDARLELGQNKRVGLDDAGRRMLEQVLEGALFDLTRDRSLGLVERGQVVETGVGEWRVHPALEDVMRGASKAA